MIIYEIEVFGLIGDEVVIFFVVIIIILLLINIVFLFIIILILIVKEVKFYFKNGFILIEVWDIVV